MATQPTSSVFSSARRLKQLRALNAHEWHQDDRKLVFQLLRNFFDDEPGNADNLELLPEWIRPDRNLCDVDHRGVSSDETTAWAAQRAYFFGQCKKAQQGQSVSTARGKPTQRSMNAMRLEAARAVRPVATSQPVRLPAPPVASAAAVPVPAPVVVPEPQPQLPARPPASTQSPATAPLSVDTPMETRERSRRVPQIETISPDSVIAVTTSTAKSTTVLQQVFARLGNWKVKSHSHDGVHYYDGLGLVEALYPSDSASTRQTWSRVMKARPDVLQGAVKFPTPGRTGTFRRRTGIIVTVFATVCQ